ncbi:DUF1844 domain-containing protein [Edaphobacter paludis]|uniref:DUF1844 domain-containing protein n=1 Tax=Edaphobacter paludis TaxID=3035702 RepID=A0AAU7D5V8_9BACT
MPEQNKPFVVTDRRKFTAEGELRPDADPSPERERHDPAPIPTPVAAAEPPTAHPAPHEDTPSDEQPALTAEQSDQARAAYKATADRLDTAIRAANPGMEHPPEMGFEQIVHSVYMTAIMQLGGATPEGQQPQVDIMGARQSVDMLGVLAEKTKGNLTPEESRLLENALFELHMGFLEITQALARSAAAKAPAPGPGRPSIVR